MNILYLHQYFKSPSSPGGTRAFDFVNYFSQKKYNIDVITSCNDKFSGVRILNHNDYLKVHKISIAYRHKFSFFQRIYSFISFAFKATIYIRNFKPDIIYASSTPLTIFIPAILLSKIKKIPLIIEIRDIWPEVPIQLGFLKNKFFIFLSKKIALVAYKQASHILVFAPEMKKIIISNGVGENKISVTPNGSDVEFFKKEVGKISSLRGRFHWLMDRKLILYSGTLGECNRVDYLVDIAYYAMQHDKSIRFAVVGDGKNMLAIKNKAKDLKVLNRNFFLLGEVSKDRMPEYVHAADLIVGPLNDNSFLQKFSSPNKLFDGIACGKPILTTFEIWFYKMARDCMLVVDENNARQASLQIVDFINNEELLYLARVQSIELSLGDFNRKKIFHRIDKIMNDCLSIQSRC
jgi:glycosyltransferase involved in cell wall biosynthesis